MIPDRKIGDVTICPICKRKFTLTENHKFIRRSDFVCSWYCFMDKPQKIVESAEFRVSEDVDAAAKSKEEKRKEYHRNYYMRKKAEGKIQGE